MKNIVLLETAEDVADYFLERTRHHDEPQRIYATTNTTLSLRVDPASGSPVRIMVDGQSGHAAGVVHDPDISSEDVIIALLRKLHWLAHVNVSINCACVVGDADKERTVE